jgi:hypothetical protein
MTEKVAISKSNLEGLARAFAISDSMLSLILAAAEQFKTQEKMIEPENLITFIHIHRPKFIEADHEQN